MASTEAHPAESNVVLNLLEALFEIAIVYTDGCEAMAVRIKNLSHWLLPERTLGTPGEEYPKGVWCFAVIVDVCLGEGN